jgi:hypothetical protein
MISLLFGLFSIYFLVNNQVLALLTTCPIVTSPSIRYSVTLSSFGIGSYSGTLLLSSNGNFISVFTIPDAGSPQSAIQGTWSFSDCTNSLTLTAQTLYFMDLPKLSVNNLTCSYTCGTNDNALRACTVTYTLKTLKTTGTYSIALDLSVSE